MRLAEPHCEPFLRAALAAAYATGAAAGVSTTAPCGPHSEPRVSLHGPLAAAAARSRATRTTRPSPPRNKDPPTTPTPTPTLTPPSPSAPMSANQRGPENADAGASALFTIDPSAVKIGKELGKGAFSVVYTGEYNKKRVAVKCQPKDEAGNVPPFVLKEVQILQRLRHPNVLEFIGAADSRKTRQILILSEHAANGDLDQLLKATRRSPETHVGWARMVRIALDVAQGIAFLHAQQFIHRDIKSSNILLDDGFHAKLCDFGFATEIKSWHEPEGATAAVLRRKSYCGTDAYMAPEMFLDEDYNENVDVFSLGVVLMELICCRQANSDNFLMRLPQHKFQIRQEEFRDALPASCPEALARLAERCVSFEPSERPTAADVAKALQDVLAQIGPDGHNIVELRPFTPIEREVIECEPQIEDEEEEDGGDDEDDEDDENEDGSDADNTVDLDDEIEATPVLPPPYFSGSLLKRNRRGNRGWSDKTFFLDGDQLHHKDTPAKSQKERRKDARRLSHPEEPMSSLHLKDCRIWKTTEMPELCFNILSGTWKIKRELRAHNREDLEKWMHLISQAIDFANDQACPKTNNTATKSTKANNGSRSGSRERHSRGKNKQSDERRPEPAKKTDDVEDNYEDRDDEVYLWLQQIGLQRYTTTFKAKGFATVDFIRETGIEKDDLNFLGIKDISARKALLTAARTLRGED